MTFWVFLMTGNSNTDIALNRSLIPYLDLLFGRLAANSAIVIYALLIFVDGFPEILATYGYQILMLIVTLSIYFVCEVSYHLFRQGPKQYFSKLGNTLDFVIVMLGFVMVLLPYMSVVNVGVLRLTRLLKLTRVFSFVPRAAEVYSSIAQALRASGAVFFLLGILIFFLALCGHAFFGDVLPKQFGTPLEAVYTIFTVFSVENWNEIPDEVVASGLPIAWAVRSFFIVVLILGGFLGLSLANAVFVDEMAQDNNKNVLNEVNELRQKIELQTALVAELSKTNSEILRKLDGR
ncbi:Ion transporter [Vibrio chagasii]|nr:Ion transporter [Vibrio chagasii]